jgi:hypothetical protein
MTTSLTVAGEGPRPLERPQLFDALMDNSYLEYESALFFKTKSIAKFSEEEQEFFIAFRQYVLFRDEQKTPQQAFEAIQALGGGQISIYACGQAEEFVEALNFNESLYVKSQINRPRPATRQDLLVGGAKACLPDLTLALDILHTKQMAGADPSDSARTIREFADKQRRDRAEAESQARARGDARYAAENLKTHGPARSTPG